MKNVTHMPITGLGWFHLWFVSHCKATVESFGQASSVNSLCVAYETLSVLAEPDEGGEEWGRKDRCGYLITGQVLLSSQ